MPEAMFERLAIDPGHRTLGELLQERQWAVQEIVQLRKEVARLEDRCQPRNQKAEVKMTGEVPEDPIASRRLLRMADVLRLVGFSRSTIYRMVSDHEFPAGVRIGPKCVRWRMADVLAWQDQVTA